MKSFIYILIGVFFGIVMMKSEAASWFRIYEMFQFDAFHMYGIIGVAVTTGIIGIAIAKKLQLKSFYNTELQFIPKAMGWKRYLFGGTVFGLGWALAGACPGPMFTLLGAGFYSITIVIVFAVLGTYAYGVLKDKLPH